MMGKLFADLHTHTTCSDGLVLPEQLPILAREAGLAAVAVTDHDSTRAIERALEAGSRVDVEVIPGVELSTLLDDSEIHILGYFIDWQDKTFRKKTRELREGRLFRAEKILSRLKKLGIDLTLDQVLETAGEGAVGRPHIADLLVNKGVVSSYNEAFSMYIGQQGPAYVPKRLLSPAEAIGLIGTVGGVPVLAHPGTLHRDELIPLLVKWGLKGIETIHPMQTPHLVQHYERLSCKHGLICTGGSDYHGEDRLPNALGQYRAPYQVVETLKKLSSR